MRFLSTVLASAAMAASFSASAQEDVIRKTLAERIPHPGRRPLEPSHAGGRPGKYETSIVPRGVHENTSYG